MRGGHETSIAALAMKVIAVAMLVSWLSGCSTHALEAPKPAPKEEPINSLALEQCVGENGQEKCTGSGN